MADEELVRLPRGQISIGGDLGTVTEGEARISRSKKLKHPLRLGGLPGGITSGNHEATGSFKCFIPEDDRELDWPELVDSFKNQNFYYKSPKITDTYQGQVTSATIRFTNDDGIECDVEWLGFRVKA